MRLPLRTIRPAGWWLDAAGLAGFLLLTALLIAGGLRGFDLGVRDLADAHRPHWANQVALVANHVGQGSPLTILCLAVAAWRARRLRAWWPVYPVVFAYVLTYVTIGPVKILTARPAPHAPGTVGEFFGRFPADQSYFSGHTTNALVWYAVLVILLHPWLSPRWRRVLRVLPVVTVSFTMTYLGFHWVTDIIAALFIGIPMARLIDRVDWSALPDPRDWRRVGP